MEQLEDIFYFRDLPVGTIVQLDRYNFSQRWIKLENNKYTRYNHPNKTIYKAKPELVHYKIIK
jgi:hypothetical protein